jgi:hypothetical protein
MPNQYQEKVSNSMKNGCMYLSLPRYLMFKSYNRICKSQFQFKSNYDLQGFLSSPDKMPETESDCDLLRLLKLIMSSILFVQFIRGKNFISVLK